MKQGSFTTAITVSWIYLIPEEINNYLKYKFIVLHDSLLPRYRGFAPTPSAIINGESVVGVTALYAANDVDSGEIIEQIELQINDSMYIKEIINKLSILYGDIICRIFKSLLNSNKLTSYKQDETKATYSIWRDYNDCRIDWNKSSKQIFNLIRAVGDPYPGAFSYYDNKKIVIEKAEIIEDKTFEIRDVGKIWSLKNNSPEIICGEGMIRIVKARDEDGREVIFNKLRCKLI